MLCSRGKAHEIISHAVAEDPDVEWSDIKRKLTSNYGSMQSRIKASVKISKLLMISDETVGEYLARARTLIKLKIKAEQCGTHSLTTLMHIMYVTDS